MRRCPAEKLTISSKIKLFYMNNTVIVALFMVFFVFVLVELHAPCAVSAMIDWMKCANDAPSQRKGLECFHR